MKVAVYLTRNHNFRDGVTHYASEVLCRIRYGDTDYFGAAWLPLGLSEQEATLWYKEIYGDLNFVFCKTLLPNRFLFDLCERKMPFFYDRLFNNGAAVHLFINNFIPRNKIHGKKAVIIHDLTPLCDIRANKIKTKKVFGDYDYTVNVADIIFTDSEYSANEIIKYFPQAQGKIVVNYCGMDYERFSTPVSEELKKEIQAEYNLPEKYFLFVGQARENKNLKNTIKGYALLSEEIRKEYKLVLANHTKDLVELSEELGVKENIKFLSGIKEEYLVGVFQMAFCELLISFSEGFGLPMVEAMAAGVPSITSNCSCLPEVAGDAALTVNPYDTEEIKKGMQRIIEDDYLRQELIEKGKNRAKDFSWEKTAQIFETKLKKLCR